MNFNFFLLSPPKSFTNPSPLKKAGRLAEALRKLKNDNVVEEDFLGKFDEILSAIRNLPHSEHMGGG